MGRSIRLALVSLVVLIVAACASVPSPSDIPASIANANTAADHTRIADFLAQKARSYDAEAILHKEMALSYNSRPKGDSASMAAHCRALEAQFTGAAREARVLEQAHRELARKTGP